MDKITYSPKTVFICTHPVDISLVPMGSLEGAYSEKRKWDSSPKSANHNGTVHKDVCICLSGMFFQRLATVNHQYVQFSQDKSESIQECTGSTCEATHLPFK